MRVAFIIVSYVENEFQQSLLQKNIYSIQYFHPDAKIVILNDNHTLSFEIKNNTGQILLEKTIYPKAGEYNAYIWASIHANDFDRFIFLHDSTLLLSQIPLDLGQYHFRPLWYANRVHVPTGMIDPTIEYLTNAFHIKNTQGSVFYKEIIEKNMYVVFGAMGIWDSYFSEFIRNHTNLKDIALWCTKRNLRCLFERLLFSIFKECHTLKDIHIFPKLALCGEIFNHGNAFKNTTLDPTIAKNPYVLKIWQGR